MIRPKPQALALAGVVGLGAAVRLLPVLGSGVPLNDGGLFYSMGLDIERSGFGLPEYTSYNGGSIPYAYPPLPFYVAALADRVTPLTLLEVFRLLPALVSVLTIPAFYLLARRLLTRPAAIAATLVFALLPGSFLLPITGGGHTRSFAYFFSLLALYSYHRMLTELHFRYTALGATFTAAAAASNLGMLPLLATGILFLFASRGRTLATARGTAFMLGGSVLLAAPWWATVVVRHGPSPFLNAGATGCLVCPASDLWTSLFHFTDEPFFPLLSALALLGSLTAMASGRALLPAWLVLLRLADGRFFLTVAPVPLALLAGIGLVDIIIPLLSGRLPVPVSLIQGYPRGTPSRPGLHPRALAALGGLALGYATSGALVAGSTLTALAPDDLAAMQWVRDATPPGSRLLVLENPLDGFSRAYEWFPALTGRQSVSRYEGYEWVSAGEFRRRYESHEALKRCGAQGLDCVDAWVQRERVEFDYLYLQKGRLWTARAQAGASGWDGSEECCGPLRDALRDPSRYQVVYDGPGATIVKPR